MDKASRADPSARPMPLRQSVFFFAGPALLMAVSVYVFLPYLQAQGFSEYMSLLIASTGLFASLFVASLVAYRLEGNPLSWAAFRERFRLRRMNGKDWLWTAALSLFTLLSYLGLQTVIPALVTRGVTVIPDSVPAIIDPRVEQTLEGLAGGPLKGNWSLAIMSFVMLFFNIFGEELWWRGYTLPRQEVVHGRYTWMIHGALWTLFHAFKYWELIAILPSALALSFVVSRRKSIWPGIVAHLLVNVWGAIYVLLLVLGAGQ